MSINSPAFCSKHFSVGFRSAFQVCRELFGGDTKLFAEKRFSIFEHWVRKCQWRLSYFLTALSWLHSRCPREHFELENVLCIVPGGWPIIFQSTGGKGFKKYIEKALCASRKTFWRNCFAKKFNNASAQREKFFCN